MAPASLSLLRTPTCAVRRVHSAAVSLLLVLGVSACEVATLTPDGIALNLTAADDARRVVISPGHTTINAIGYTTQLTVTVRDKKGTIVAKPNVSWSSLNVSVATVDRNGQVTAVAPGVARITASSSGQADTAQVEVRQIPASVGVTPSTANLVVGEQIQLLAMAADSNGMVIHGSGFSWHSSDAAVAVPSATGLTQGITAGAATITAAVDGLSGSASLSVATAGEQGACSAYAYERLVRVRTAAELSGALNGARAGDLIHLEDGIYRGRFSIKASGTAAKPITLCGSRNAVIDGGSITEERAAIHHTASHWRLAGFTIRNAKRAILAEQASHNVFRELEIHDIGQEAVHIRIFSSHNTLERSTIRNTGLIAAEWGEGIYVGSWNGHWCTFTGCQPDRSDYNQILGNRLGPNIAAEHIDIKEGTSGGVVRGNHFDGVGMIPSQVWIDSWVLVQGNGYTISDNTGSVSLGHGFKTEVMLDGWGNGNSFTGNTADVQAFGFGFRIGSGSSGNTVACANAVRSAGMGFANVPCK